MNRLVRAPWIRDRLWTAAWRVWAPPPRRSRRTVRAAARADGESHEWDGMVRRPSRKAGVVAKTALARLANGRGDVFGRRTGVSFERCLGSG